MAWRFGFSFGLVTPSGRPPAWPRAQLFVGRMFSCAFFRLVDRTP
jgi:hypothetical protein